ncbi:MAG: hypothetical protein KME16_04325 [Scytolyngbya sp. HA4215-MV1]|nr:hypothetical protein [Scytolyngbya sp. HA4215-MV1]
MTLAGALALLAVGCSSEPDVSTSPAPSPAASPTTAASPSFAKPLIAQKPGGVGGVTVAVPGLIQPVNPDERARQVQASISARKSTKDPFSNIPPSINNKTPFSPPQRKVRIKLPQLPTPGGNVGQKFKPGSGNLFPPGNTSLPTLPPAPQADLAKEVEITGVVKVAGVAQAIVKAPNESTSRYVRVGQRLSNGQILVKRIEMYEGADPVVILEENGVEVAKAVGEKPAVEGSGNSPNAALPPSSENLPTGA